MAQYPAVVQLSDLDGTDGFRIDGADLGASFPGFSDWARVAGAGDVNGDGFADLVVGDPLANPNGYDSGSSYVIFGKASGFDATFDLASLDGTNGFRLDGSAAYDFTGFSVASAGDVNGDGYGDVIIGAYSCGCEGSAYVVFGSALGFDPTIQLADLDGSDGYRINQATSGENTGWSVASAGDFNGDGVDDLIVGAPFGESAGSYAGSSYLVFGGSGVGVGGQFDLGDLDGSNGFRLDGAAYSLSGTSVASAGDVNGDGFSDLIIGAYAQDYFTGDAYVVFGGAGPAAASLDLTTLNGTNGFRIEGIYSGYSTGLSVASAGDINGDGFADLLIGAYGAGDYAGATYVVFGKSGGFNPVIDLAHLNGINGFRIVGEALDDNSGYTVASAGDVNGDGFDDLIIGAPGAYPGSAYYGAAYVVFGHKGGFGASFSLASLDGTNGFRIEGQGLNDAIGFSVSGAGDVNGDGLADLIVSTYSVPTSTDRTAYVMFGRLPDTSVDRVGTAASQSLVGGDLDDTLIGARGDDALWGHDGTDRLVGSVGDDTLKAGDGSDRLLGGDGDDLMIGGAGKDAMRGGDGADVFTFAAGESVNGARDHILDFEQGSDLIDLSQIDADTGTAGDQEFTLAAGTRFSGTAGELIVRYNGSDTVVLGDTDGDSVADFALVLTGTYTLTTADFIL